MGPRSPITGAEQQAPLAQDGLPAVWAEWHRGLGWNPGGLGGFRAASSQSPALQMRSFQGTPAPLSEDPTVSPLRLLAAPHCGHGERLCSLLPASSLPARSLPNTMSLAWAFLFLL